MRADPLRVAFEQWMTDERKCVVGSSDPYPAGIEREAWAAWQAGAAAALRAVEGWRSIDSAPRDGTVVWVGDHHSIRLAFWQSGAEYEYRGSVGGGWRDNAMAENRQIDCLHFTPTHWLPVPLPPAGEGVA